MFLVDQHSVEQFGNFLDMNGTESLDYELPQLGTFTDDFLINYKDMGDPQEAGSNATAYSEGDISPGLGQNSTFEFNILDDAHVFGVSQATKASLLSTLLGRAAKRTFLS